MKWSTFKLRFKRAVICSWKDHEFARIDAHGRLLPLYFCDRCGALRKDIYYPALDKTLAGQGRILERAPFEHDKFGTYSSKIEKKNIESKDELPPISAFDVPNTTEILAEIDRIAEARKKDRKGEVWDTLQHKFIKLDE